MLRPGVVQPAKRPPVDLPSELARRRVRRRRQRARRHHVHRARETRLRHHLPRRMQQQREPHARVVDESLQRRLDPRSRPSAMIMRATPAPSAAPRESARRSPRIGDDDDHEIAAPPAAQIRPRSASSWRNDTAPNRAARRREPRLAVHRRRQRGDAIAVLPEPQVRIDDEPVALGDDQARPHAALTRERLEDRPRTGCVIATPRRPLRASHPRASARRTARAGGAGVRAASRATPRRRADVCRRRRHRDHGRLRLERDRPPVADVEVPRRRDALRRRCRSAARRSPARDRCPSPSTIQRRRARSRWRRAAARSAPSSSSRSAKSVLRIVGRHGAVDRRPRRRRRRPTARRRPTCDAPSPAPIVTSAPRRRAAAWLRYRSASSKRPCWKQR